MGRCLIIANQTLGGAELDRAVRDCISRDVSEFYIAVPVTPVEHESPEYNTYNTRGFASGEGASEVISRAMEEGARRREAAVEEADRRAQSRLDQMIERIQSAGGQADGALGVADPVETAKAVLADQRYDEVIVSTLPSRLSRWLKMDLPSRVARMTDAPVTTIEAKAEAQA